MKKIFLTAAAALSFMLAGAQTTPTTTPPPTGSTPVKTDVMEQDKREMEPTPDGVSTTQPPASATIQPAAVKPATREPLASDHVKSTPAVDKQRDTTAVKRPRKAKRS